MARPFYALIFYESTAENIALRSDGLPASLLG